MVVNLDNTYLRKAVVTDIPYILSVRNDESTRKWLGDSSKFSIKEGIRWFNETKPIFFIILEGNEELGYLRTSDWTEDSVCVGCDIDPKHRGKGLGYKAYLLLFEHLKTIQIRRVWLKVFRDNTVAVNLYEKLGFVATHEELINERSYVTMKLEIKYD